MYVILDFLSHNVYVILDFLSHKVRVDCGSDSKWEDAFEVKMGGSYNFYIYDKVLIITINGCVINTAPDVMILMRENPLRGPLDLPESKSLCTGLYKKHVHWYFYVHGPQISKPAWLSA